jgi:rhodanese-related sulfurtransferase
MTASWLHRMGWETHVLDQAFAGQELAVGPEQVQVPGLGAAACRHVGPPELAALIDAGHAAVIDLDTSLAYRDGHIPGAVWAIRGRLARALPILPADRILVLASPDGVLARLAAAEIAARDVRVLLGGTAAWRAAGLPLETGAGTLADATIDVWYRPYDRQSGVEQAMKGYLDWEVDLVAQVERDGDARFRL